MHRQPLPTDPEVIPDIPDPMTRLLAIMALLRDPERGCPWDRKQTLESLKSYLVEETYETLDAIDSGDLEAVCGELGDVLLQIVFQAQIAAEEGAFDFHDVAEAISNKLIHRHPHVFGDARVENAEQVLTVWEERKRREGRTSLLAGVPRHLPALQKAQRMSHKAARVGFDWPDVHGLLEKVQEESEELAAAAPGAEQLHEYGDLLFAMANLGRHLGLDAEEALQAANERFIRRFGHVERRVGEGERPFDQVPLEELESYWQEAKAREREEP